MILALATATIVKWALVILAIPLIVYLVRLGISRSRALNQRIEEYRAEQEAKKNQPGPINPYADLEKLFEQDEPPDTPKPAPDDQE